MKNKRIRFISIVFACLLILTGCGDSLYEMTDSEEQIIVHYAAYVVSKYNKMQKDGMNSTVPTDEDIYGPTESQEDFVDVNKYDYIELGEAIGQKDVDVTYKGVTVENAYREGKYYSLTPDGGKKYAVLSFTIYNPYIEAKAVDAFDSGAVFSASFNHGEPVRMDSNYLTYSLPNYIGTIGPGESVEVVMLFQVSTEVAASIDDVSVTVEKDGTTYAIDLQNSES